MGTWSCAAPHLQLPSGVMDLARGAALTFTLPGMHHYKVSFGKLFAAALSLMGL